MVVETKDGCESPAVRSVRELDLDEFFLLFIISHLAWVKIKMYRSNRLEDMLSRSTQKANTHTYDSDSTHHSLQSIGKRERHAIFYRYAYINDNSVVLVSYRPHGYEEGYVEYSIMGET